MAYGNTNILAQVASEHDLWLNAGDNSMNLMAGHNPALALILDKSTQPGASQNVRQGDASGRRGRISVWGSRNTTVAGVTRANQPTAQSAALMNPLTAAEYYWAHIQGIAFIDYREEVANQSPSKIIDVAETLMQQTESSFYEVVGDQLLDNAADAENHVMALDWALNNSGSPGGIDTTDTVNNGWWASNLDSTSEVLSTTRLAELRVGCVFDSIGGANGNSQGPDCCFMRNDVWTKILADLTQSQRTDVQRLQRGGAEFFEFAGMRCFNTNRLTAGRVIGINTNTLHLRYATKAPQPVTNVWTPVSLTPALKERGYNWIILTGFASLKHQFMGTNKTAA